MAVYTKTGDKGKTGTFGGKRVSKSSKLISTIGVIDELNSYLGIIGGLVDVQRNLFTINSILSGAKLDFTSNVTKKLEKEIDDMEGWLPVLQNFIIYGGNEKAAQLYYARAICRRAERSLVSISDDKHPNTEQLKYLNRLSDYLFMLARLTNFNEKIKEENWKS